MKKTHILLIIIGILVITFGCRMIININQPVKKTLKSETKNYEQKLELTNNSVLIKIDIVPQNGNLREIGSDHLKSFRVSGDTIFKGDRVIWNNEKEHINFVQESPDGSMLLFYKQIAGKYVILGQLNGKYKELTTEIPRRENATREDGCYWVGNNILISEYIDDFDPVPKGYGNEGWVKGSKLYAFDLTNKTYGELKLDDFSSSEPVQYKMLTDEHEPSYSYKLPILRYYRIKGITDEGVIFLTSVDTSEPLGGNPKDEGAFEIKAK
jgi:hypothetical protein